MFTGLFTALITPFKKDGSFEEEKFAKILEQQISAKVDGVVILGTTGESPTITQSEHAEIIKKAVKIVDGRIKVIAGTGSNCTAEAIEYSQKAEKDGADALLVVSPYYNKPTQKGLYEHFVAIAESVKTPIILYNILGRCGVNIETETVKKLAKIPNIIGVKEASGNLKQMQEVINSTPEDFIVLSGDDSLTLDLMKMGGHGVISVISNPAPQKMKKLVDLCTKKQWEEATKLNEQFADIFAKMFIETNPQPVKTLMAKLGFCEEVFRLPLTKMEANSREILFKSWDDFLEK